MPYFGHLWPSLQKYMLMLRRISAPTSEETLQVELELAIRDRDELILSRNRVMAALREALPAVVHRHNEWIKLGTMSREACELVENRMEIAAGLPRGIIRCGNG